MKKTPAPKKGTRKNNKKGLDLEESMTQALQGDILSNSLFEGNIPPTSIARSEGSDSQGSSSVPPHQAPTSQAAPRDKSDVIVAYTERLDQPNQALTKRVAELETNRSASSTPLTARTRPTLYPSVPNPAHLTVPTHLQADKDGTATVPAQSFNPANSLFQPTAANIPAHMGASQSSHQSRPQPEAAATLTQFNSDGIVPSLSTLRQNQEISHAVNQVLSSYENQARLDVNQGKGVKKSGRFNTTDAVTSAPHLRWPNEGLASVTGKKRGLYIELSVSEWAAGQLSNIYLIQDPVLVKQTMLQAIQVLTDATSLSWQSVRTAYAQSMHQVEQVTLSWQDNTQWALNRISSSQIAMANASVLNSQQNNKKICKFYNEGVCTNEGNHGIYKHICNYCAKLGKNLNHPETKCVNKQRGYQGQNISK